MPSSLTSRATWSPARLGHARPATSGALEASIGSTGRPDGEPERRQRRARRPRTRLARSARCRRRASRPAVRRAAARRRPTATASWTRASRAPWRTDPVTTPRSQSLLGRRSPGRTGRRRPSARASWEPGPESAASVAKVSSTSRDREASGSRPVARAPATPRHPRPVRRWSRTPLEVGGHQVELVRLRRGSGTTPAPPPWPCATGWRATSAEVATTSASSIGPLCYPRRPGLAPCPSPAGPGARPRLARVPVRTGRHCFTRAGRERRTCHGEYAV